MSGSYKEIFDDNSANITKLRKEIPEVMTGFAGLHHAVYKEGSLDKKTKELITVALSIAARCPGCIASHMHTLIKLNVTRPELLETLGMAIYMGGGPSLVYAAEALKAYDDLGGK